MSDLPPSVEEEARVYSLWDRGTFPTVESSVSYHHRKHGLGMSRWDYVYKASTFERVGAAKMIRSDSLKYSRPNGEFLVERGGKILSYGPPRR